MKNITIYAIIISLFIIYSCNSSPEKSQTDKVLDELGVDFSMAYREKRWEDAITSYYTIKAIDSNSTYLIMFDSEYKDALKHFDSDK